MKLRNRTLLLCGVGAVCLALMPHKSYALGGGGTGFGTIGSTNYNVTGLGPLSGTYNISGGIDGWASVLNNPSPNAVGHGVNTLASEGEVFLHITKSAGPLQLVWAGGQYQTPAMGLTSNAGNFNSIAPYGSASNPRSNETFYSWVTYQPSQYYSVSVGRMASVEGVEFGIDFLNPSFFVSELNNLEATPGYGPQLNLFYGNSTINIQYSDTYLTGRHNMLSAAWTYNLNPSGSDYIIGFAHTNLGHTGNPGPSFAVRNSTLFGVGGQWLVGNWSFVPEVEYQYLPRGSVTRASGDPRPMTTYYNIAAMTDITYQFNKNWSVNVQPQYVYQNNDKKDPNANIFGNWLQYGVGSSLGGYNTGAPGTFSAGTSMMGLQITPTWQQKNFFVRATAAYTHVSGFAKGTGYGLSGNSADQVVGVLEVGFLLGQY